MSDEKQNIKTELSLPEKFEDIVSDVQKEMMEEELGEFAPIKKNDVNISSAYIFDDGDELEAKVYFRNGFANKVNFEYVPLMIINSKGEVVASKVFDLRDMGDIPSGGARPWKVCFEKSLVDMGKFKGEQCKVVFNTNIKAVNYANIEFESFPEPLNDFKPAFDRFLQELPKIEKDKLSISKFNIALQENGQVITTLVIRNSCDKAVSLDEIPITIKDGDDNTVLSGKFNLNNYVVNSMKARVCNLAFESNLNVDEIKNTDDWKVIFQ